MIGAQHLPQILRIEARGQRGRADQIAEHDGELPPLGLGRECDIRRLLRNFRSRCCGECLDRVEQSPAMPNRADPQLAQIVRRQAMK